MMRCLAIALAAVFTGSEVAAQDITIVESEDEPAPVEAEASPAVPPGQSSASTGDVADYEPMQAEVITDDAGLEWVSVARSMAGRPSWYVGLGYEITPARIPTNVEESTEEPEMYVAHRRSLSHVLLHFGGGWALAGQFRASARQGERTRVRGNVLYFHFALGLGIGVSGPAIPTYLSLGGRFQYVRARTRHAFAATLSSAVRWETNPIDFGWELATGVGYAYVLSKAPLPVQVQYVLQGGGSLPQPQHGIRLLVAWSLGT